MEVEKMETKIIREGEYVVSKEDAPCPFLVLDALRDGKPHGYPKVIEELAAVAEVSKKAVHNIYRTVSLLVGYDQPLIEEERCGCVTYLTITDVGKAQLQRMKSESPDYTKSIIWQFKVFFTELLLEGSLEVVREGGSHIFIHMMEVEWFDPDLGDAVLGNPRHMLALAEEAFSSLFSCLGFDDESVNIHLIYPCSSPTLYFFHINPWWEEIVVGGVSMRVCKRDVKDNNEDYVGEVT